MFISGSVCRLSFLKVVPVGEPRVPDQMYGYGALKSEQNMSGLKGGGSDETSQLLILPRSPKDPRVMSVTSIL